MKKLGGAVLFACMCVGLVLAQAPKVPTKGPSVSDAVKQLEHDWTDAMKAGDADKLGGILADDWTGLGFDGKKATKQSLLADLKSGASKIESFEFGPMDVKVLGSVAVVQGSDTENKRRSRKRRSQGKNSRGQPDRDYREPG